MRAASPPKMIICDETAKSTQFFLDSKVRTVMVIYQL